MITEYFKNGVGNELENSLLNICSKLSELGYSDKLNVPDMVVCATQSSGKSLTLNRIMGNSILPVGRTMTTRTPIRIEMRNNKKNEIMLGYEVDNNFVCKYRYNLECGNSNKITNDILEITKELVVDEVDISDREIILKINSEDVVNLNLVDLPGLIAIDKTDKNIKEKIRNLVSSYISKDNVVILGIFPAREDIEADYALELIKMYDNNFSRTIGCLTKIDLLSGGNVINYLEGNICKNLRLKYGYYGVKNNGDEDIYFKTHDVYSGICVNKLGIGNLTLKLNKILIERVKGEIPVIMDKIEYKLEEINNELLKYGIDDEGIDKKNMLNIIINKFSQSFINVLENNIIEVNYSKELKDIFIEYRREIMEMRTLEDTDDVEINELIKKNEKNRMFIEIDYMEILEKIILKDKMSFDNLKNISIKCVSLVYDKLLILIDELIEYNNLICYKKLGDYIKIKITEKLDNQRCHIIKEIDNIISYERSYIWTDDKVFIEKYMSNGINKDIKNLCVEYYKTIKGTLMNILPKMIMKLLIRELEESINMLLMLDMDLGLLCEDDDIIERKTRLKNNRIKLYELKDNIKILKNIK